MTDIPNPDDGRLSGDGGAEPSAPPSVGDRMPTAPAADPAAAARAYAEAAEPGPASDAPTGADAEAAQAPPPERTREELEEALAETQVALAMAEAQRDEHLADLQRKAAELSNVLKREQRTADVGRMEGRADVMRPLLDVLDDFDRTMLAVAASEDEGLRSGVALVHDKLAAALTAQGLARIGEVGDPFDPNRHEAVQQLDAEDGPLDQPLIDQLFRPGYLLGDRVLRPAMVVVRQ